MPQTELPHETAIRERAAFAYAQDWKPSADLLERTVALSGLTVQEAEAVLRECVSWKGGLETALNSAAMDAVPFERRTLLYRYDAAIKAAPVQMAEAA